MTLGCGGPARSIRVRHWDAFAFAARELGGMQRAGQLRLKIRSGEHLVAIALSGLNYPHLPAAGDQNGEIDLSYGEPLMLGCEIKSIGRDWRHRQATISVGGTYTASFVSWAEAMPDIERAAQAAAAQLNQKLGSPHERAARRRCVGVFAFLLDLLAVEVFDENKLLPEPPPLGSVDTDQVFFILHPATVQVWHTKERHWTTVLAAGRKSDGVAEPVDLHELERLFLNAAGLASTDSPFFDVVDSLLA